MRRRRHLAGTASLAAALLLLSPAGPGARAGSGNEAEGDAERAASHEPLRVPSDPSAGAVCEVTTRPSAGAAVAALKMKLAREQAAGAGDLDAAVPLNGRGYGYSTRAPRTSAPALELERRLGRSGLRPPHASAAD